MRLGLSITLELIDIMLGKTSNYKPNQRNRPSAVIGEDSIALWLKRKSG